jgi:photosystem II stability/assembly factor-like uncharacterized protein
VDVETELRRLLLERPGPSDAPDVVPAVHAGMRRRVRRQRLSYVAAAAAVLAVWGGALLVLRPQAAPQQQVPTKLIANVPRGFEIRDLTFMSTTRGFALGSVPCPGGNRCTVLLQTDTGTRGWERAPAPLVRTISHVRFAIDARGNEIGYAFGPAFLVFRDGEWVSQPAGRTVEALEAAKAGTVVRVLARRGGGHYIQQSEVGSDTWRTVHTILAPTFNAMLRRQGDRLVLVTYDNNVGAGAEPDVSDVRVSSDGGSHWTKGAHNPCDGDSYLTSVALAKQPQVLVLCTRRAGGSYVRMSSDNGRTFGPVRGLPDGATATQVAAPARGGWLVAADVPAEGTRIVLSSKDDGVTWQRVATESGTTAEGYLDNSNGRTVWWVGGDPRFVWRSDDAGQSWTAARFR